SLRMNRDGEVLPSEEKIFLEQKERQNVFDWDGGWKEKRDQTIREVDIV
ncbi:hypothetical protein CEXT_135911, partial [Caerostris extrusa]